MFRIIPVAVLALALAVTASASSLARWTPAQAAAKIKATYTAPDAVRLKSAQASLAADLAAGLPETDPRVIRNRGYVDAAMHGAVVQRATCAGVGRAVRSRFSRFHCSASLIGKGEYATDGFHPTVKLTVRVATGSGFSILSGWR